MRGADRRELSDMLRLLTQTLFKATTRTCESGCMTRPVHSDPLLSEKALGQYGCVQRADRLSIMTQPPNWWHTAELPFGQEALGFMDSVLLLSKQQLLAHVVFKLVLRWLFRYLNLNNTNRWASHLKPFNSFFLQCFTETIIFWHQTTI